MNKIKSLIVIIALFFIYGETHAAKIQITSSNELTTTLKKQNNQKKILLFFTSWCPYCKTTIQEVIDSKSEDKVTFISLDKEYTQISAFSPSLPDHITIYYMTNQNEIVSFFNRHGIRYKGAIPYISILDEDNDLLQDDLSPRQLQRYLR